MGIYIPNMEKPKRCGECDLWSNCFYPKNPYTEQDDYIVDDCPLIEINEPKVGKWIDHKEIIHTDPEIWGYSQECSLCGFTLGAKEYNYCPNCGAKMERRSR